jgi:hypothetical protein
MMACYFSSTARDRYAQEYSVCVELVHRGTVKNQISFDRIKILSVLYFS